MMSFSLSFKKWSSSECCFVDGFVAEATDSFRLSLTCDSLVPRLIPVLSLCPALGLRKSSTPSSCVIAGSSPEIQVLGGFVGHLGPLTWLSPGVGGGVLGVVSGSVRPLGPVLQPRRFRARQLPQPHPTQEPPGLPAVSSVQRGAWSWLCFPLSPVSCGSQVGRVQRVSTELLL